VGVGFSHQLLLSKPRLNITAAMNGGSICFSKRYLMQARFTLVDAPVQRGGECPNTSNLSLIQDEAYLSQH